MAKRVSALAYFFRGGHSMQETEIELRSAKCKKSKFNWSGDHLILPLLTGGAIIRSIIQIKSAENRQIGSTRIALTARSVCL
jgi:hypothetical protein